MCDKLILLCCIVVLTANCVCVELYQNYTLISMHLQLNKYDVKFLYQCLSGGQTEQPVLSSALVSDSLTVVAVGLRSEHAGICIRSVSLQQDVPYVLK